MRAGPWAIHLRIIFRHLLPNSITPAVVYWMTDMALAILLGSSLGYLGLGAQPPSAEWGVQIADGKISWRLLGGYRFFPGMAIVLTGLGFSLTGDGLAEILREQVSAVLEVRNLTTRFNSALVAVNDVSFTLQAAEFVGLVGESGSGRSWPPCNP